MRGPSGFGAKSKARPNRGRETPEKQPARASWVVRRRLRSCAWRWEVPADLTLECEQKDDGRWPAEVPELAGVLAYGSSAEEAMTKAETLAFRVLAQRLEHGKPRPAASNFFPPTRRMTQWPSTKTKSVLAALAKIGRNLQRQSASHGKEQKKSPAGCEREMATSSVTDATPPSVM